MELLQLKYFCDAAKSENFSRTAAKFSVPSSNISQSIKRLEGELGTKLFERRANRVTLSEDGRLFYEKAASALEALDEGREIIKERKSGGSITILAASVRRVVMQTVEKFKRAYPGVEITLSYDALKEPWLFDAVITGEELSLRGMSKKSILRERMVLALNKSHPLAKKETVTVKDIATESFISMSKDSNLSHVGERIFRGYGFSPNVSIRCDDPYYVRKCVEHSLGIAVVPEVSWRGLFGEDVVLKSFCDYERETFLYISESGRRKSTVERFSEMLALECENESRSL